MGEETYIMAHKIGFIKEDYESKETEQKREVRMLKHLRKAYLINVKSEYRAVYVNS